MILLPPLFQTSLGTPRDVGSLIALLSQEFGAHPEIYGPKFGLNGHNGLDWPCGIGTAIHASHDGIISNQTDSLAGIGVVIKGQDCKTIYWHLKSYTQLDGAMVKKGDIIGLSDNTGYSTGPHLHFGLKMLDSNGNVLNRNNGFDGAIDPTPYLVWTSPQSTSLMTKEEVEMLYEILDINDPDNSGRTYWEGKPLGSFLKEFAKNKAAALEALLT